ncbi:acyl dehydratase [Burkholderia sp. Ch1-1]|uniref:Acyl dehydratase n=1 Tax=Paraburkholderia dioscoreae TaxID=2604047 RepID=A0A5Q4ZB69_9BURK|nr:MULTISPECIES: MaoC family dehydratase [Paraburkholderia]EIF31531.1 acyl dehydratase [Burkholderia sp. Ch1-1]MDR8398145.1 MaoC family dehydratase [Paraburkholderia sp. USG1]VVD28211.1 Acyl dehydratase [Paraburkholderia dioscoreae]
MRGLYFEEFTVGMRFDHALTRTVTEWDNMQFSNMTMNPQPLHVDAHFAASTEFGKPLVNSLFTLGLMIGISVCETTLRTTIANLGMTDVSFPAPVFQGDTLHVRTEVLSLRASASRPGAGIVEFRHAAFNQNNVEVARCTRAAFMHRSPA